jgi:hypothetical protein
MTIIQGYNGAVTIDSTDIGYLTEVNIDVDQPTKEIGPFIGNNTTLITRGGLKSKGSAKGVMVNATDSGQQSVIDAINGGSDVSLVVEIDDPAEQTYTAAVAIISNLKIGLKSDEGAPFSFDWQSSGGYTLA